MPDTGFLFLSLLSVVVGAMFILVPDTLLKLSGALNRTLVTLDERLLRYRHLLGLTLLLLSYGLFQLALIMPSFRG